MTYVLGVLGLLSCLGLACGSITFIALGDWGANPYLDLTGVPIPDDPALRPFGVDDQARVRDQMETFASLFPTDFIITTGDNFYDDGVTSLDDPRWDDAWRNVYNTTHLSNLQWRATLGNHDHVIDGRYMYQVNMTFIDPNWYMPNNYYDYYVEKDGIIAHFIALDTELITFNQFGDKDIQLAWLNETLENRLPSDWLFVYGHHPMRSCGRYSPGNFILKRDVLPVLVEHGVDFYVDGHDHNLQHIIKNDTTGPQFIVTGSGGKGRYEQTLRCGGMQDQGYSLEFFAERYGFVSVFIEKDSVNFRYYGDLGTPGNLEELYSFTATKGAGNFYDY